MFATVAPKPAAAAYTPCLVYLDKFFFILTTKNTSLTFTLEISEKSGNLKRI